MSTGDVSGRCCRGLPTQTDGAPTAWVATAEAPYRRPCLRRSESPRRCERPERTHCTNEKSSLVEGASIWLATTKTPTARTRHTTRRMTDHHMVLLCRLLCGPAAQAATTRRATRTGAPGEIAHTRRSALRQTKNSPVGRTGQAVLGTVSRSPMRWLITVVTPSPRIVTP